MKRGRIIALSAGLALLAVAAALVVPRLGLGSGPRVVSRAHMIEAMRSDFPEFHSAGTDTGGEMWTAEDLPALTATAVLVGSERSLTRASIVTRFVPDRSVNERSLDRLDRFVSAIDPEAYAWVERFIGPNARGTRFGRSDSTVINGWRYLLLERKEPNYLLLVFDAKAVKQP